MAIAPTPRIHARTRSGMRIPLRPAQECDAADRQPLGYKNVAVVKKNRVVRRDEFSGSKLRTGLAAARSHFAIFRLAIPQLRHHVELTIENTHLAVQIGAHHPLTLSVEVAGHSQMRLIFNGPQVSAVEGERLNAAVSAIGHN